jgi:hypothetical protein
MEFETTKCCLKPFDLNKVIIEVVWKWRLYKLVGVVQSLVVECNTNTIMDKNDLVKVMNLNGNNDLTFCNGCVYSKHHCTPFPFNGGFSCKGNS